MDKLQWFKFTPSDWFMGKIQRCSEITQARFLRLCCLYWNKECNLSIEDATIEIDKEHLDILISKKIISVNNTHLNISFLDEQFLEIQDNATNKSTSGIIGNLKRWHPSIYNDFVAKKISLEKAIILSKTITDLSHTDSTPIADQSQDNRKTSQIREDKTIQDESKKDESKPPKAAPPDFNKNLNNLNLVELSNLLLENQEHSELFGVLYPKLDFKATIEQFYTHKVKGGVLTDSYNNFTRHFFNWLKVK